MAVGDLVDEVIGVVFPDDPAGIVGLVKDLIALRNAVEARLAAGAALIERLGLAKRSGSTTSTLLQANGAAPATAARWLRIGTGLTGLDRTAGYFRDGFLRRACGCGNSRNQPCSPPCGGCDERRLPI
jgi:hypothetical protein